MLGGRAGHFFMPKRWATKLISLPLPGLTLVFWLVLHGRLTGALVHSDHVAAVNPRHLSVALLHNFVLSGRLFVALCAALSVRRLLPSAQTALQSPTRSHQSPATLQTAQLELLASLTLVVSWPLLFPATLPRYMLPTLPLFCALAGVGIIGMRRNRRFPEASVGDKIGP